MVQMPLLLELCWLTQAAGGACGLQLNIYQPTTAVSAHAVPPFNI